MFNLREYIKKGFLNAIGKMADYQIILNSTDGSKYTLVYLLLD